MFLGVNCGQIPFVRLNGGYESLRSVYNLGNANGSV